MTKLTEREARLIAECDRFSISTVGDDFYRLGGYGCVQIRFSARSLPALKRRGFVTDASGCWKATEAGVEALNAHYQEGTT